MSADTPLRSCGTFSSLTLDRCTHGHALCKRCQEELNTCEVGLEEEANKVRGIG